MGAAIALRGGRTGHVRMVKVGTRSGVPSPLAAGIGSVHPIDSHPVLHRQRNLTRLSYVQRNHQTRIRCVRLATRHISPHQSKMTDHQGHMPHPTWCSAPFRSVSRCSRRRSGSSSAPPESHRVARVRYQRTVGATTGPFSPVPPTPHQRRTNATRRSSGPTTNNLGFPWIRQIFAPDVMGQAGQRVGCG